MSDSSSVPNPAPGSAGREDAAERLGQLWRQGQRPDVDAFLAQLGPLPATQLGGVLRVDQRQRWPTGERVSAESYLRRYPAIQADTEGALDLIFNEFLVRDRLGEGPGLDEYLQRFPEYADVLRAQIELYQAMQGGPARETAASPPPSTSAALSKSVPTQMAAGSPGGDGAFSLPLTGRFGRYDILQVLGQGGMATVYLAHDTQLDRRVALKVSRFGGDDGLIQRFYREARIAAAFTHPHLCPVYDFGQIGGIHYLTMPFLRGETLSAWLQRESPLPQRTAARFTALVARALEVAHGAGVIHRDLKPANVLITEQGEPVVMDFGLARREGHGDPRLTESGAILGTPAYLPPEQIGGSIETVGPACDIYSLGIMLYEMLTGQLPFHGSTNKILRQTLTCQPEPPSRHRTDLDARLESTCLTAIAKAPEDRFLSMERFAVALEDYLEHSSDPPQDKAVPATADAPARAGAETIVPGSTRPSVPHESNPFGTAEEPARGDLQKTADLRNRRNKRRWVGLVLAAFAVAILAGIAWMGMSPPSADAIQSGSHWVGTFHFLPPNQNHTGDVHVTITDRIGNRFRGTHATEGGKYEWLIEGTVQREKIRWELSEVIKGGQVAKDAVGKAWVDGTCAGEEMQAVFHDPDDDTEAEMKLRLRK